MAELDGAATTGATPRVSTGSFDIGSDLSVVELPSTRPLETGLEFQIRRHPLASLLVVLIIGILIGKAWD